MNNLNELIGQKVTAIVSEDEDGYYISIECKITAVMIEDYYFEEKQEEINIIVSAENINDLPEGLDRECLSFIPLHNIRR
tara:strand:- start:298 stop:537 length:240 start_codon:yes stop_codon:yes gene_type:complete